MRVIAIILMSLSVLLSGFAVVSALKELRQYSSKIFHRTRAGLLAVLCLYLSLILSLVSYFQEQVFEWVFSEWGFVPVFGLFAMAGLVVSGINAAYKQGRHDGRFVK